MDKTIKDAVLEYSEAIQCRLGSEFKVSVTPVNEFVPSTFQYFYYLQVQVWRELLDSEMKESLPPNVQPFEPQDLGTFNLFLDSSCLQEDINDIVIQCQNTAARICTKEVTTLTRFVIVDKTTDKIVSELQNDGKFLVTWSEQLKEAKLFTDEMVIDAKNDIEYHGFCNLEICGVRIVQTDICPYLWKVCSTVGLSEGWYPLSGCDFSGRERRFKYVNSMFN
jgi:hypothetical protein